MPKSLDALLAEVSIVHHIPGRVRLKLARRPDMSPPIRAPLSPEILARFFDGLAEIPGIHQVKLNPLAKSCTLEYDSNTLADHAWRELFSPDPVATLSGSAQKLREGVRQTYQKVAGVSGGKAS
ncbi:hypothetical protein FACS1894154_10690 [Betaproteobacteria bacterium]|nr:hypothetical protein FACS1894154_10690 [Betaproteobacteria bacterium]GHU21845.1 hypothetical protein FACS189488_01210 [Betaproteobacteria bacterium]GHU27337.1 hypothetical protein FACS189497_00290 [Betaproteobacteria bacterium]